MNRKHYQRGYTTGVYDMFHIGHLNILENAKKYCDELVVGVSTDELVREYKGHDTIIPFEERIRIIAALRCVDKAVPQRNMDKLTAMLAEHCDAIFVGDDWKGTQKWLDYEREFEIHGIEVVYLPYTKGTSSTQLRERLGMK
ncbi:adenylyltransferase/cytidyltransferase family protein [[Ruminococcus] lactaris]|uniref:adenylyltransferase/cytidyltransferase family protein n=1 Tax=[Ruminococcus] lactaris TaxID=46228 RepID=UPI003522008E